MRQNDLLRRIGFATPDFHSGITGFAVSLKNASVFKNRLVRKSGENLTQRRDLITIGSMPDVAFLQNSDCIAGRAPLQFAVFQVDRHDLRAAPQRPFEVTQRSRGAWDNIGFDTGFPLQ